MKMCTAVFECEGRKGEGSLPERSGLAGASNTVGRGMAAVRLTKVSGLHSACGAGDIETVQAYASNQRSEFVGGKRVMIFHLDPEGASPLALAAMGGHTAVVELLLRIKVPPKSQADVNGQSLTGASPLMLAAQHGHTDMVKLLLRSGADALAVNKAGDGVLHYAARNSDSHSRSSVMEALAAAGADAALKNAKGLTAADIVAGKEANAENTPPAAAAPMPADLGKGGEGTEAKQGEATMGGTVERYVTSADGRRVKQVLDLSKVRILILTIMPTQNTNTNLDLSKVRMLILTIMPTQNMNTNPILLGQRPSGTRWGGG